MLGVQIRHPLALAQYANHPSKGSEPNVVPAPFDFHASHVEGKFLFADSISQPSHSRSSLISKPLIMERVCLEQDVLGVENPTGRAFGLIANDLPLHHVHEL